MAVIVAVSTRMALGEDICATGVTFAGFTDTILNGDYIGQGLTNRVSASFFEKDGAGYPHDYWVQYDSPLRDAAKQTSWSIYARTDGGKSEQLVAWCVPGVGGCPVGPPSSNDGGHIWPASVGTMHWNVTVNGKTTLNTGITATCCKWPFNKCDSCKCADNHFKFTCKSVLTCGEDCCNWVPDPVIGHDCVQNGIERHCDHSSASATVVDTKQSEVIV